MFEGSITALVTPFADDRLDEVALRDLVEWQIEEGIFGLVPCGTTRESPTLSKSEHKQASTLIRIPTTSLRLRWRLQSHRTSRQSSWSTCTALAATCMRSFAMHESRALRSSRTALRLMAHSTMGKHVGLLSDIGCFSMQRASTSPRAMADSWGQASEVRCH